ncbi:hypothetical protein CYY_007374 [Polysphondylium violaceum]|uniref:WW domain-containing protein n=1 Tax=Polysphondylium violaceum TaxID=133409 RepID=A0A8J4V296_9MYCE|nr:hypothetical protein CYY_007374 [Polysphondylium violaceum]
MDIFNISIHSLSISHSRKKRSLYVVGDFDAYKQFKTELKKSSGEGECGWGEFKLNFEYQTKFIHKLDHKHFKLYLYKKKSLAADSLVGQFQVDLYTLATGPISHDVIFTKGNLGVGRFQFKLEMSHVNKVRISIPSLYISNLISKSSNDLVHHMEYSLNKNNVLKMPQIEGSTCPSWFNQVPIEQQLSLKDLVDSNICFTLKEQRSRDNNSGELLLPVKSIFSFIEGDMKCVKSFLVNVKGEKVCDITVKVQFNNIPQLSQMRGGIQTESGIRNAEPFFSGVPLPKLVGEISSEQQVQNPNQQQQAIKLPAGWEARYDNFGRVFYIDHNTKQTTWISPLVSQPVENKKRAEVSASRLPGSNGSGNESGPSTPVKSRPAPSKQDKDEAAKLIQKTFRKHKKEHYNKTVRNPKEFVTPVQQHTSIQQMYPSIYNSPSRQTFDINDPLPNGWEIRMDRFNRVYYVDHVNKTTTWSSPNIKPRAHSVMVGDGGGGSGGGGYAGYF